MRAFRFRLQAILTLRQQAEQAAQQQCARAYEAVERATGRLRGAEAAIVEMAELRLQELAGGTRADRIEHLRQYTLLLDERRTILARELEEARDQAELARQRLVRATQQRETLDRLRERQRRKYAYAAAQAEQKLLDDLAGRGSRVLDGWREPILG